MNITQPVVVVLLRRSENEKTPLAVMPHEIEVLKALHGEDAVLPTEDTPPVASVEFDPEEEYTRLQGLYIGNDRIPNPVREGVGTLEEFVESFEGVGGGDDEKDALIEKAKSLGLKATKNWGIEKLETEIAEAEAKLQGGGDD